MQHYLALLALEEAPFSLSPPNMLKLSNAIKQEPSKVKWAPATGSQRPLGHKTVPSLPTHGAVTLCWPVDCVAGLIGLAALATKMPHPSEYLDSVYKNQNQSQQELLEMR